MSEIKLEFAVQMTSDKCAEKVRRSLENVGYVEIDVKRGSVIIDTNIPWSEIQNKIEKTGKRAVLSGFGGQAAVAMVTDNKNIKGVVRFSTINKVSSGCVVDGVIDGLEPGLHGFHIHECGDISKGFESLGEHYNPRHSPHGSPDNDPKNRHTGDLGNIKANCDGRATFRFIDPIVEIWDIIGRSVVITSKPDDGGKGNHIRSLVDGNCGERIACGIIARAAGIYQNYKRICACDGLNLWDERDKPIAGGNRNRNEKNNLN